MTSDNTAQRIRQTFLQMLKTTPAERIKVSVLAQKAGISRGTFYTHYTSPYDVLEDIEAQLFNGIPESAVPIESKRAVHEELVVKLSYIRQHAETFRILMGVNGDPYFSHQLDRFFSPLVGDYISRLQPPESNLFNEALNGARVSLIRWWLAHLSAVTIEEVATFLTTYIQAMVKAYMQ